VPLLAASTVVLQLDMSWLRMLFCRMLSRAEQVELAVAAGRGGQREQPLGECSLLCGLPTTTGGSAGRRYKHLGG
jgi:hypothetical protein